MIGEVALFLDVYPEYKCETYRFRFPESENTKMKEKKKLSLAGQIFIFNAQPFAFVQGAKQIAADRVHRLRPPFRGQ